MNRLRELRKAKGLTTIQLGKILNLDPSALRHVERGERNLSTGRLKMACEFFGVPADYLLGIEESKRGAPNRLKELRTAKGMTIRQLGTALGMGHTHITQIENGHRNFTTAFLRKTCEYFGVSTDYMLRLTDDFYGELKNDSDAPIPTEKKYIRKGNQRGYVEVYYPETPMARKDGWVLLHRLVMSKHIGRPLRPEEVVHHINGDPSDNRLSNLMLFANSVAHLKYHAQQRRDDEINKLLEQ